MKRHIPNIITALRIALCVPMLLAEAMSPLFVACYLLAGLSDMIDGAIARRLDATSDFGSRLDSIADFVFVVAAFAKLFPLLNFPRWIWLTIIMITVMKIASIIILKLKKVKDVPLHTKANKITGFVLFVGMIFIETTYFQHIVVAIIAVAMLSAVDEMIKVVKMNFKIGIR